MKLRMWPSSKVRTVQCRRGTKVYRQREVPPNTNEIEYPALALAIIELLEDGKVVGTVETHANEKQNRQIEPTKEKVDSTFKAEQKSLSESKNPEINKGDDSKINQEDQSPKKDPLKTWKWSALKVPKKDQPVKSDSKEKADAQPQTEKQPSAEDGSRLTKKDDDNVLKVGTTSGRDGRTFSGEVQVQVSSVDNGDARLGRTDEHRPEGSPDGIHSEPTESKPIHDRREEGVSPVSPTNKDTGRD